MQIYLYSKEVCFKHLRGKVAWMGHGSARHETYATESLRNKISYILWDGSKKKFQVNCNYYISNCTCKFQSCRCPSLRHASAQSFLTRPLKTPQPPWAPSPTSPAPLLLLTSPLLRHHPNILCELLPSPWTLVHRSAS